MNLSRVHDISHPGSKKHNRKDHERNRIHIGPLLSSFWLSEQLIPDQVEYIGNNSARIEGGSDQGCNQKLQKYAAAAGIDVGKYNKAIQRYFFNNE